MGGCQRLRRMNCLRVLAPAIGTNTSRTCFLFGSITIYVNTRA